MKRRRERTVTQRSGLSDRYPPILEKIADTLIRELPPDWTKTWASAEMEAHQGGVFVYYLDSEGNISWITPPLALYERFRELHHTARTEVARMARPPAPWTTATLTLEPTGKFQVDDGYDPVPIDFERERRAAWKARYLPPATR